VSAGQLACLTFAMSGSNIIYPASSSEAESTKARAQLLGVVERCQTDRYAYFPEAARERILRSDGRDIVLMGGQRSSLAYHLDLIQRTLTANPGLRLRALVDESPETVPATHPLLVSGTEIVSTQEFLARSVEFRDALVVDRYCTWIPGVKYRSRLKQAGIAFLRLEQFLNAPGLTFPPGHYRQHSDFMLREFDRFLALENIWADERSRTVYYTSLAAAISLDFTWFAFGCDNHDERYLPSDIGLLLGDDETFVDCGAHDGSESILFAKRVKNRFRSIRAFEPDRVNFSVTSRNLQKYSRDHRVANIYCYPMGVYDRNGYLGFTGSDVMVAVQDSHVERGPGLFVTRLDDMIEEMTYLKLEIEGAELAALHGAHSLIRTHKPVLAISCYHKPEDFLELSSHVLSLDMGYRMTLRHHSLEPGVLCIYCQ